jgi:hypothetical protein
VQRTLGALGKMLYDSKMMKSFPQPFAFIAASSLRLAPGTLPALFGTHFPC